MTILTLTPFDFHETLWAFIRPWVKRNVTIFLSPCGFPFPRCTSSNFGIERAYDNFESLVTSKVFDLGQCIKVHIIAN